MRQDVEALEDDPVLRRQVALAAVEVDDAHLQGALGGRGDAHGAPSRAHGHQGVAEEAAMGALRHPPLTAVMRDELQPVVEGAQRWAT
jgi:hypothetical protein